MKYIPHDLLKRLLQSKIFFIILVLVAAISFYQLATEISRRIKISSEITELREQKIKLERERESLSSLIQYLGTDRYIEEEARKKLNMQKPGEKLIVVTDQSDTTRSSSRESRRSQSSNANSWWRYFFYNES